jgi:hypothetical protein
VWVDSSLNLGAAENSLWFSLRIGKHMNQALQAEWETHSKAAFRYAHAASIFLRAPSFTWITASAE